jgi:hypothetical protein
VSKNDDGTPKKKDKKSSELSDAAAKLGAAGGKVGGKKRAEVLSAEERSAIARKGGLAKAAHFKDKAQQSKRKKRES